MLDVHLPYALLGVIAFLVVIALLISYGLYLRVQMKLLNRYLERMKPDPEEILRIMQGLPYIWAGPLTVLKMRLLPKRFFAHVSECEHRELSVEERRAALQMALNRLELRNIDTESQGLLIESMRREIEKLRARLDELNREEVHGDPPGSRRFVSRWPGPN